MIVVIIFSLATLALAGWIWAKVQKSRRLTKLKEAYRVALHGGDEEEAVALGRAYYYLLNGYTGLDDEQRIRRDWKAIQQNRNAPSPKRSSTNLFIF